MRCTHKHQHFFSPLSSENVGPLSLSVALLFIILMVLRRVRDTDRELTVSRAPLLRKERPQGRFYGIPCDGEPVYAGW